MDGPLPIGDVAASGLIAAAATMELTQRVHVTYTRTNAATGQVYSGRTSGYGDPQSLVNQRVAGHPDRLAGFGPGVVDRAAQGAVGYAAIRGREQQLIDFHGGALSQGGSSGNLIRGVSPINPAGRLYHATANQIFGNLSPYSGR